MEVSLCSPGERHGKEAAALGLLPVPMPLSEQRPRVVLGAFR